MEIRAVPSRDAHFVHSVNSQFVGTSRRPIDQPVPLGVSLPRFIPPQKYHARSDGILKLSHQPR